MHVGVCRIICNLCEVFILLAHNSYFSVLPMASGGICDLWSHTAGSEECCRRGVF